MMVCHLFSWVLRLVTISATAWAGGSVLNISRWLTPSNTLWWTGYCCLSFHLKQPCNIIFQFTQRFLLRWQTWFTQTLTMSWYAWTPESYKWNGNQCCWWESWYKCHLSTGALDTLMASTISDYLCAACWAQIPIILTNLSNKSAFK